MSEKTARTVRLLYGCVLSFLLVLTGLFLILSALAIYYGGGESPYTPEAIGERFSAIALPVSITLGAIVGGIVLHFVLPAPASRPHARIDRRALLARMEAKKDATAAYTDAARKERRLRLILRVGTGLLSLVAAIPAILHLSAPESFRYPAYNDSVIAAMPSLLLFSASLAILLTVCGILCDRSYARQMKVLATQSARTDVPAEKPQSTRTAWIARVLILAIALVLLTVGIIGGGMEDVLSKAINICTECIGLG